jgi:hypothetical protein
MLLYISGIFCQVFKIDSTNLYKKKGITIEEANIVSSYYSQDGNHSAVTGGIGTEKLTDFANTFDIKFFTESTTGIRHHFGLEVGVDYYSSASSDNIDTRVSSASSQDVRFYPSINYSKENLKNGNNVGGHLSFSSEYDYKSIGTGINTSINFGKYTNLSMRANGFYDLYDLYIANELRSGGGRKGKEGTDKRISFDGSLSLSQILHPKIQMSIILDAAYQTGFLSTPFHRVYREDGTLTKEILPSTRFKLPIALRLNTILHEKLVLRSYYRYFKDSWNMHSHTINCELPVRLSQKIVAGPYYRYYTQAGNSYFGAYQTISNDAIYATSDYDLSDFNSHMMGIAGKYNFFKQNKYITLDYLEYRAGYYKRSDGLNSWIITIGFGIKEKNNR